MQPSVRRSSLLSSLQVSKVSTILKRVALGTDWFFGQGRERRASNHSVLALHLTIALLKFDQ